VKFREQFESKLDSVDATLHSPEEPCPMLTMNCKKCDYFETCMGSEVDEHIFNIPRLSEKTFQALVSSGYISIHDIPDVCNECQLVNNMM